MLKAKLAEHRLIKGSVLKPDNVHKVTLEKTAFRVFYL